MTFVSFIIAKTSLRLFHTFRRISFFPFWVHLPSLCHDECYEKKRRENFGENYFWWFVVGWQIGMTQLMHRIWVYRDNANKKIKKEILKNLRTRAVNGIFHKEVDKRHCARVASKIKREENIMHETKSKEEINGIADRVKDTLKLISKLKTSALIRSRHFLITFVTTKFFTKTLFSVKTDEFRSNCKKHDVIRWFSKGGKQNKSVADSLRMP